MSIEAAKWAGALERLGWRTTTVAGTGQADVLLPSLAMDANEAPRPDQVRAALDEAGADLVIVENLCSLPLNPGAANVVADVLRGRPAVFHHHDLPWQRPQLAHRPGPPDDPAWAHVTINELSRGQLGERGMTADTVYNHFDTAPPAGDGPGTRAALGLEGLVLLHPSRALPRKGVAAALALAEALDATYWLLGPAEDGYEAELHRLLQQSPARSVHQPWPIHDAYAAADAVVFPSTWEGFGNATVESATHGRPLAIGAYPVAEELAAFGFRWFPTSDPAPLAQWLVAPDARLLDDNLGVARRHFDLADLPARLAAVLEQRGWWP